MRGVYVASVDIAALSAAKSLILLEAPATQCVEIIDARVTDRSVDTNEQLECAVTRVTTKGSPTGATTVVVEKTEEGDAAHGCTFLGELSAEPTTYASSHLDKQGFSNLSGYVYTPLPEARPIVSPSGLVGLRLTAAPAGAHAVTAQITFRVIGG